MSKLIVMCIQATIIYRVGKACEGTSPHPLLHAAQRSGLIHVLLARRALKAWRARGVHSALGHRQDLLMGLRLAAAHHVAWIRLQGEAGESMQRATGTSSHTCLERCNLSAWRARRALQRLRRGQDSISRTAPGRCQLDCMI